MGQMKKSLRYNMTRAIGFIFLAMFVGVCQAAVESRPNAVSAEKLAYRVADCGDRSRFAAVIVQLRDGGASIEEINKGLVATWPTAERLYGKPIPGWYKLDFERIIGAMILSEPTSPEEFGKSVGEICAKNGPWLDSLAR
jgi:hypothetical protein